MSKCKPISYSDDEFDAADEFCANWSPGDLTPESEESTKNKSAGYDCSIPNDEQQRVLATNFGHTEFRPLQWKIISSIINESRDVCAVIATGYGKSLCYQYPPVYKNGVAIVISPLISLMEDQVLSLTMSNIPACFLGSAQTKKVTTMKKIKEGMYKVIYVTPEYVTGDSGMYELNEIAETNNITLLAIDEAHCVSKWGHDFRPQYRNLWKVRNVIPNVPVLAVTATATPRVQEDISNSLKLRNPLAVSSSFDRPNLFFEAKLKSDEPYLDIQKCMNRGDGGRPSFTGSTIIYCITQKKTEAMHSSLLGRGIKCAMYHAGMRISDRRTSHEEFVKDKVKCIVATIAFGMGIDKPDVRNVIHYGASKDLEGYYQEVGRAGRDGLPAKCTVFFSSADFHIHGMMRETLKIDSYKQHLEENSNIMEKYLNTTECRRKFILRYFNDKICHWEDLKPRRNCCDNCIKILNPSTRQYEGVDENGLYNMTEDAKLFVEAVNALNGKFGITKYCLLLKGSKTTAVPSQWYKLPIFGKGSHKSNEWWKVVGRIMQSEGYLSKITNKLSQYKYSIFGLSSKGYSFLNDKNSTLKITPPLDMKKLMKLEAPAPPPPLPKSELQTTSNYQPSWISDYSAVSKLQPLKTTTEDPKERELRMELYKLLLNMRNEFAYAENCSPYMVASNIALMNMSKIRPKTILQFQSSNFDGMNENKIQKYGQKFVDAINKFCSSKSFNSEAPEASYSAKEVDKPGNKTGISSLKKFAFVENKIKVSENIENDFDDDMGEISDAALNDMYDDLDESFSGTKVNETKNEKTSCSTNLDISMSDDDALDLLVSLKRNATEPDKTENLTAVLNRSGFEEELFDDDWLNSPEKESQVENEENSTENLLKETAEEKTNEERKPGIKNKRCNNFWGVNKKHFSNKFLDI